MELDPNVECLKGFQTVKNISQYSPTGIRHDFNNDCLWALHFKLWSVFREDFLTAFLEKKTTFVFNQLKTEDLTKTDNKRHQGN